MKVISREEAKNRGFTRYFTGKPCKRGHVAERDVSNWTCVECSKISQKNIYRENPEPKKRNRKKNYWSDPESHRQWHREYYARNKEKRVLIKDRWRKNNPDHVRKKSVEYAANRRARLINAKGNFTSKDVEVLKKIQKGKCANCKEKILNNRCEIDHIFPLSKGGDNSKGNLQILCVTCNREKGAMTPHEWAQKNGRLL